ncbi:MAG TPA: ammonium transporter [Paracoccus sp. (in: a-proteobacteria)]|nr:ammonium transporter [Paracoccus sp. (in: a-proteobacteria)]
MTAPFPFPAALRRPPLLLAAVTATLIASAAMAQTAAPPPVPDKGDTVWMMVSTLLVILMTVPGLALFYGGMVRARNMLSVLTQVFAGFCVVALLWVIYGYSLAFTGPADAASAGPLSPFVGGLSKLGLAGVGTDSVVEGFSKGVVIPELTWVIFQLTFAALTPALIVGAVAERMKFSAVLALIVIWFTFAYLPMAHMVWFWGGPSAHDARSGFLFAQGALDFAGGTVVHINSGVAGLVAALMVGPRLGYRKDLIVPHNLTFTMIGACLLWVGWFGFNAGSNLEANGVAAQAMLNTIVAPAAAALAWMGGEWLLKGHPSLLGAVSGAVAGMVAITPAAGFAGTMGAIAIGLIGGFVCMWAVIWLKQRLGYDDSLDVFGIHGVGGIVGALLTGVFADPGFGGAGIFDYGANAVAEYHMGTQIVAQATGVVVAMVWSALVTFAALTVIRAALGGLRVDAAAEREGLDLTTHGERAYN